MTNTLTLTQDLQLVEPGSNRQQEIIKLIVARYNLEKLYNNVPSVFACEAHAKTSDRYKFFPTIAPVVALIENGWQIIDAFESRARKQTNKGFMKHMIRFKHVDGARLFQDVDYNMLLTNSHDGTSAYALDCALFRMICSNGMVAKTTDLDSIRVRHTKNTIEEVIGASNRIIEQAPMMAEIVKEMSHTALTDRQRMAFAHGALALRWKPEQREQEGTIISIDTAPIKAEKLLKVRRNADMGTDLFTTLNVVQEHLIKGNDRGFNSNGGRTTTREVKSVTESTNINKGVFEMADWLRKNPNA